MSQTEPPAPKVTVAIPTYNRAAFLRQTLAGIAHNLCQAGFDVEVHIFQVQLPLKLAFGNFFGNLRHAALNVGKVLGADDFLGCQHFGVS